MREKELFDIIDALCHGQDVDRGDIVILLDESTGETDGYLFEKARSRALAAFGNRVFTRGLIEFTNHCKNNCYYCGIRRGNNNIRRYRLSSEEIMRCCEEGYADGFKTFVLQGGEDPGFSDNEMTTLISDIKSRFPDCALTLSIGEKPAEVYKQFYNAGADRYLLRHETANGRHYAKLHPKELSLNNRLQCLMDIKNIGFQTGAGFMVGSPFQTTDNIAEDLMFIKEFEPHMIGIGPFLPHHDTPFCHHSPGSVDMTLRALAITRLLLPNALIPATTALGTAATDGRQKGVLAGANVVMPNISPSDSRKHYMLYDGKTSYNGEISQGLSLLHADMASIGYEIVMERGDHNAFINRYSKRQQATHRKENTHDLFRI